MPERRRPGRPQPSLFAHGERCERCPGRHICGARATLDACGDKAEYPGGLTVDGAPSFSADELEFPAATWPELPPLPASWVVGTTTDSTECSAIRLKEALRYVRQPVADLSTHGVVLHGQDRQLLRLGSLEGSTGPALQASGVPFVVGPAFSTWWTWSPFDSLVAMARSAHFAAVLARAVPTIPSVVWRHDHDLSRWARWIATTGSTAVAVDLGTLSQRGEWAWCLDGVEVLGRRFDTLGTVPHLVVNGPFTVARMSQVAIRWPGGLTFASQRPWQLAKSGRLIDTDLQDYPAEGDQTDLAHANRRTFDTVAQLVIHRARLSKPFPGTAATA